MLAYDVALLAATASTVIALYKTGEALPQNLGDEKLTGECWYIKFRTLRYGHPDMRELLECTTSFRYSILPSARAFSFIRQWLRLRRALDISIVPERKLASAQHGLKMRDTEGERDGIHELTHAEKLLCFDLCILYYCYL